MTSPTIPPPRSPDMSATLQRNIHALEQRRAAEQGARTRTDRVADAITGFAGSMAFVYLHAVIYGFWIVANLGLVPGVPRFDKSFVILATEASVEAIFLSTFVLISQNKMMISSDKRANLDLQVNLLAEHEITKVATMLAAVMEHLGLPAYQDPELEQVARDVAPEVVLDELEHVARRTDARA